jgi:pimeloyl-ACP methyl ester carboxylesterase
VLGLAEMPSYWERLPSIETPVTLVVGALDAKLVPIARAMYATLPRATLVEAPGVGHNVLLEAPACVACSMKEMLGADA